MENSICYQCKMEYKQYLIYNSFKTLCIPCFQHNEMTYYYKENGFPECRNIHPGDILIAKSKKTKRLKKWIIVQAKSYCGLRSNYFVYLCRPFYKKNEYQEEWIYREEVIEHLKVKQKFIGIYPGFYYIGMI